MRPVLELLVVRDVDSGSVAEEIQDVAQARVGELDHERFVRLRVQQPRARLAACLLPHRHDGGRRPRSLDLFAEHLLQVGDLDAGLTIGRIQIIRTPVLAERTREIALLFQRRGHSGMVARGAQHRPLERNPIVGAIDVCLHRLPVVLDRGIPVAGARRQPAVAERLSRRATGRQDDGNQRDDARDAAIPSADLTSVGMHGGQTPDA